MFLRPSRTTLDIVDKGAQCMCCASAVYSPVAFIEYKATCVTTLHQLNPPETGAGTDFLDGNAPRRHPSWLPRCKGFDRSATSDTNLVALVHRP